MEGLETRYRPYRQLIPQLLRGQVAFDPQDKKHADAIDVAGQYATDRLLWDQYQKEPGRLDRVMVEFEREVKDILRGKESTQAVAQAYSARVAAHALDVLKSGRAIAKVNAARMMADLADLRQGELADSLVEALKDPNEGVQYWVLRGLHDLLAQPPREGTPVVTPERADKCARALVEFLSRKPALSPTSLPYEVDGYRVLRREGLRALAQTHNPALGGEVRPALTLLQFVANDEGIVPPARIDERLEAAIGLAQMRTAQAPDYQPDYAAQQIGLFVRDFGAVANAEKDRKAEERTRPWKIDAARLSDALGVMKADTKNAYVGKVIDQCQRLLDDITKGGQPNPGDLGNWLEDPANQPGSKELIRGIADTAVKPRPKQEP